MLTHAAAHLTCTGSDGASGFGFGVTLKLEKNKHHTGTSRAMGAIIFIHQFSMFQLRFFKNLNSAMKEDRLVIDENFPFKVKTCTPVSAFPYQTKSKGVVCLQTQELPHGTGMFHVCLQ